MVKVKESLKSMTNYVIQCGPLESTEPDETVELRWVDNDKNFGIGYALIILAFIDVFIADISKNIIQNVNQILTVTRFS